MRTAQRRFALFASVLSVALLAGGCPGGGGGGNVPPPSTWKLSGHLSGAWVEGVTVTLGGAATATTTTDAAGGYSFTGLTAGAYSVNPSLVGWDYSPSSPTVTLTSADVVQDFSATPLLPSFSISGAVSYTGSKGGRIYVNVLSTSCPVCSPIGGTALTGPGGFTVRGLGAGSYTVWAWRDVVGEGIFNLNDPSGMTGTLTITTSDLTAANVTLADPPPQTAATPTRLAAYPGDGGAAVFWDRVEDPSGNETVTGYKLYRGTDPAASNLPPLTIAAREPEVFLQSANNGAVWYFKISSLVGTTEGTSSAVVGPITIGAIAGPYVLTGQVTFPVTATGPLFVGVYDQSTGVTRLTRIANPTSPQPYVVTGIPNGSSYYPFAILDMNDDGLIDAGDLSNAHGGTPLLTIGGATTKDFALSGAGSTVSIATRHAMQQGVPYSDWYGVDARLRGEVKVPITAVLYSGPRLALPIDVSHGFGEFDYWPSSGATRPAVGDTYRFKVSYADGTAELKSGSIAVVLDAFATSLTENVGSPYSPTVPQFLWTAPSPAPPSYTYRIQLWGPGASWFYPRDNGLPSGTTSVVYDVDGSAVPPLLVIGTTYWWQVSVEDPGGNTASVRKSYVP